MSEEKYYPIDAFYSYQHRKLYYIIKKVDVNGEITKVTGFKEDPEFTIKLAPFTKKLQYLIPKEEINTELKLKYSQYTALKKGLTKVYEGKRDSVKKLVNKYPTIMSLQEDIYDDYKIETQFLQQDVFSYDSDYVKNINIGIWDIEVFHDDKEFPKPEEAKYPINAIAHYELSTGKLVLFFLRNESHHPESNELKDKIIAKIQKKFGEYATFEVRIFDGEIQLLSNYLKYLDENVDVLVGWNSLDFDTVYLHTRCLKFNMVTAFGNAFGEMYETMNIVDSKQGIMSMTKYTTKILSLDYIHLIKFYSFTNYPSYSLNRIAEKLLKDSNFSAKVQVPNLNIEYLQDPANFAIYNVGDVLLNKFIDDKLLFVKLLFKQKTMTRGFGASTLSINNILDSYISLQCKREGMCCISPTKVKNFYSKKIWHIYRKVNFLSDERLKLIQGIREENKTFSLFSNKEDLDNHKYDLLSEFKEEDLQEETVQLSKKHYPFIWEQEKYPGAYVKAPKKGIYLNVVDLDATAFYPTSIYTTNCSSDTWVYQIPENIALKWLYERDSFIEYVKDNPKLFMEVYDVMNDKFKRFCHMEILDLLYLIYDKELVLVETGAVFIPPHLKEGFYRKLIKYPISERQKVKAEMKELVESKGLTSDHPDIQNLNTTQLVYKITANSCYGFLAFKNSRLFNIILAGSITLNCQFAIRYVSYNCDKIIEDINKKHENNK